MDTIEITEKPIVAAFDFDGTITTRDTLLPFIFFVAGSSNVYKKLFKLSPYFLGFVLKIVSRQKIKEKVLQAFFAGMPSGQLYDLGSAFAASDSLKKMIIPAALKRLEWHKRQKHHCVLVSASIDVYLEPWTQLMGFDSLLCSKIDIDSYGIVTGKLEGNNCWGQEKSEKLEFLFGSKNKYILYAYGDSRGDKELLSLADHPYFRIMPSTLQKTS